MEEGSRRNHADRNLQLQEAFQVGSYEDKFQQEKLKNERKSAWLKERIVIKLLDGKGKEMEGCTFVIARNSLSREALQLRLNRCPHPCIVDYVYDNTGAGMLIEDMFTQALPPPVFYVIVPERLIEPFDIMAFTNYDGQTGVFIRYVPLTCEDRSVEVDEITLREWILFAIMESDSTLQPFLDDIERSKRKLKEIQREIKSTEKKTFYDSGGNIIEGDLAEKERNLAFSILSADLLKEEEMLQIYVQNSETHVRNRKRRIGIQLIRQPLDHPNVSVCTWQLLLYGIDDAKSIENNLMDKKDWAGIRLASHSPARGLPPWVGRAIVPIGTSSRHADYSGLEVKIQSARIMRVPHGAGVYRALNRQSSTIAAERYELFYGNYSIGRREGNGIEFDDSGVYTGGYRKGFRRGHGRLDLGCGTSIVGNFDVSEVYQSQVDGGFENPYLEGEPHGEVEILFGDGGWYKGEMVNGIICGVGEYQSGFGDILKV